MASYVANTEKPGAARGHFPAAVGFGDEGPSEEAIIPSSDSARSGGPKLLSRLASPSPQLTSLNEAESAAAVSSLAALEVEADRLMTDIQTRVDTILVNLSEEALDKVAPPQDISKAQDTSSRKSSRDEIFAFQAQISVALNEIQNLTAELSLLQTTINKRMGELSKQNVIDTDRQIEKMRKKQKQMKIFGFFMQAIGVVLLVVSLVTMNPILAPISVMLMVGITALSLSGQLGPNGFIMKGLTGLLKKMGVPEELAMVLASVIMIVVIAAASRGAARADASALVGTAMSSLRGLLANSTALKNAMPALASSIGGMSGLTAEAASSLKTGAMFMNTSVVATNVIGTITPIMSKALADLFGGGEKVIEMLLTLVEMLVIISAMMYGGYKISGIEAAQLENWIMKIALTATLISGNLTQGGLSVGEGVVGFQKADIMKELAKIKADRASLGAASRMLNQEDYVRDEMESVAGLWKSLIAASSAYAKSYKGTDS